MSREQTDSGGGVNAGTDRASGICIAVGAVILAGFILMHPTITSHDPAGFVAEMGRKALLNSVVHGTLMGAGCLVLLGFIGFAGRPGHHPLLARAGLLAHSLGWVAMLGAATINGFIVPNLVMGVGGNGVRTVEELAPVLSLCSNANGTLTRMGVVLLSLSIGLWSLALARRDGALRAIGVFGLICGVLLITLFAVGHLRADVHGMIALVMALGAWYTAVAVQLIRGRL